MPSEQAVIDKLATIPEYTAAFATAFPASQPALSYANLREAIAAFERTLRSESRFDDYLRGDASAMTEQEKRGLKRFMSVNCVRCHDGQDPNAAPDLRGELTTLFNRSYENLMQGGYVATIREWAGANHAMENAAAVPPYTHLSLIHI